jgi:hypothetical protein
MRSSGLFCTSGRHRFPHFQPKIRIGRADLVALVAPLDLRRLSKNAKIPFDELRVSGKILSIWISNRSG